MPEHICRSGASLMKNISHAAIIQRGGVDVEVRDMFLLITTVSRLSKESFPAAI